MYYAAFDKFRRVRKIDSLEKNDEFCKLLDELLMEHLSVIPNLVMGAIECSVAKAIDSQQLDKFMSSILRSRISRRVIAEQHLALTSLLKKDMESNIKKDHDHKSKHHDKHHDMHHQDHKKNKKVSSKSDPNAIGAVFWQFSAKDAVLSCGSKATDLIQKQYPDAIMPKIVIESSTDTKFRYMQSHLDYILGELLRNSIEATVKKHYVKRKKNYNDDDHEDYKKDIKEPPPILVSISSANDCVLIRISDQGGGIPKELLPHIWSFAKSEGGSEFKRFSTFNEFDSFSELGEVNNPSDAKSSHDEKLEKSKDKYKKTDKINRTEHPTTSEETDFLASLSALSSRSPNLKLGMGLPLSKVYVDYWNGHIDLQSLEGYGVDVFLRISRLGTQSERLQLDRA